ncbi:PREDICTED: uncharacterized protein LOC109329966 isoform X2 [Lupinus angustifolius]|uniref:uncharacterized protein LOC109329966 isoform X2 n=1 Tax=Lupinus angustifolius TaxID=3871 RepID=UPI00092FD5C0|nr:PREDICTED: uncharacterized protein LOC109329966 isoform X2 [Lupinus angustifolius]
MSYIFSFYIFSSSLAHIYATHNILQSHILLLLSCTTNSTGSTMVPDLQKPRVIEIHVRMDCNGCMQKVKKALNGINDPEKVVKAIKKTRTMTTICNIEQPDESP